MTVLGAHPARLDLVVHTGDPVDFTVPVLDTLGVTPSGWPSGWTAAATATAPDGTVLHTFTATLTSTTVEVAATGAQTAAWAWSAYAARLKVTVTPPAGAAETVGLGWVRLYRP